MKRKNTCLTLLSVVAVLAVIAMNWPTTRDVYAADTALAIYNVENMICEACARKVQNALMGVTGIGKVEVSVTTGHITVEYDVAQTNPATIVNVITAAGYPATLRESLGSDEYRALKAEDSRLSDR